MIRSHPLYFAACVTVGFVLLVILATRLRKTLREADARQTDD